MSYHLTRLPPLAGSVFASPPRKILIASLKSVQSWDLGIPKHSVKEDDAQTHIHYLTHNALLAFTEARMQPYDTFFRAEAFCLSLIGSDKARHHGTLPFSQNACASGLAPLLEPRPGAGGGESCTSAEVWPIPCMRRRSGAGSTGSAGGWGDGDANLSALEGPGRCQSRRGRRVTWHSRRIKVRARAAAPVA